MIVHLLDALEGTVETLAAAAGLDAEHAPRAPTILAFNKSDGLSAGRRAALLAEHPDAVVISALTGDGVPELLSPRARDSSPNIRSTTTRKISAPRTCAFSPRR